MLPRPRASSLCSSQSFAVRGQKQGKGFTVSQGVPACEAARLLLCEGVLTPLSLAAVNTLPSHCSLRHPAATVLRPESQERPSSPPAPRPRSGHLLALPQPGPRGRHSPVWPCGPACSRCLLVAVIGTALDVPDFHALLSAGNSPGWSRPQFDLDPSWAQCPPRPVNAPLLVCSRTKTRRPEASRLPTEGLTFLSSDK